MSQSRTHVRRSASEWNAILARYETSDQSQRDFCRSEGVALASFLRWRRRLGAQAVTTSTPISRSSGDEDFIELTHGAAESPWSIEIELPGVCILRFRS